MDFKRIPFGPIPALLAIADEVTKVHAICVKCGNLAYATHRITKSDKRVLLGEKADYEPLCRACYMESLKEETEKNNIRQFYPWNIDSGCHYRHSILSKSA